jgi:hypothetical protein
VVVSNYVEKVANYYLFFRIHKEITILRLPAAHIQWMKYYFAPHIHKNFNQNCCTYKFAGKNIMFANYIYNLKFLNHEYEIIKYI